MSTTIKASYNQAVDAYKKANHNIKTSKSAANNPEVQKTNNGSGVLYSGDNINIISQTKIPQFSSVLQQLVQNRIQKMRKSDKVSTDAMKGKADMVEVMAAINESEVALQEIITVRDKVVSAYLDILKMPL